MTSTTQTLTVSRSDVMSLGLAALVGLFLVGMAGFARADIAHDAAHDSRHAIAFPCH